MNDRERLLQTLAATYAYYERELSEFVLAVWMEDMADYPVDAVCAAFTAHRRDPDRGRFLPKTADIIAQLDGDATSQAAVEWAKVLRAACNGGGAFDGPTGEALEAIGGMGALRRADERENGFLQKRFADAFRAYKRRAGLAIAHETRLLLERARS